MRVALVVEGTRGDVYPLLTLGEALRAAGHSIRMCAPPDFREATESRGIEFRPVGIRVRDFLTERAGVVARGGLAALREFDRYGETALAAQFAAIPEATRDADLILGAGVQFAGPSAAELHGVPYRFVVYCPALLESREHAPPLLPTGPLPVWVNRVLWRAMKVAWNRGIGRHLNRQRAALGLPPVADTYRHLLSSRPILAVDVPLAPAPDDEFVSAQQIPCLHPLAGEALPEKLEHFLKDGEPPVYLGFGSMPDPDPEATTGRVLDALDSLGLRAVVSQGWAGLAAGALPANVFATGPVSHAALFPRTSVVVHHGGAGTTTTAARAGVPQIVVPHLLDQYYWGRRVSELGLGPPAIRRTRLDAGRLAEALASVLDNDVVHERARQVGQRCRDEAAAFVPASLLDL
jgi:UDP:flavonoid glycosyltransferase YjiC (YdhE family)